MHIDDIPKKMKVKGLKDSIFWGTRYCFVYDTGDHSTPGDPYGYVPKYKWEDAISVLWNKEELDGFRPNDTVHGFKLQLIEGMQEEIKRLKKLVPRAQKAYKSHPFAEPINLKQRYLDRIAFLESNTIVFVEIEFGKKGEDSSAYY